jgi:hypothetical protein
MADELSTVSMLSQIASWVNGKLALIRALIPSQATSSNQLADKAFVNSSIATATATFRGTYNVVSDLSLSHDATHVQIGAAIATKMSALSIPADNNDYMFIQIPTSDETPTEINSIERYKFDGTTWSFEYQLNNSGFTSAQWATINSGITSGDVAKLSALPTNDQLNALLGGKQDVLTFDNVPTQNSNNPVKSGGVYNAIKQNTDEIDAIKTKIPSSASSQNKLATEGFVNTAITTNSATYLGSYNVVTDLGLTVSATRQQIITALTAEIISQGYTPENNDYAFVQIPTSDETPTEIGATERYKYNGTAWLFEYEINNSGFTEAQWAAINSGATLELIGKLDALPTNAQLIALLNGKGSKVTVVQQNNSTVAINPNVLNVWGEVSNLVITFVEGTTGEVYEYMIQFTSPSDSGTSLTLPSAVRWANNDTLEPEAGYTYQVSIVDNLAVYAGWEAQSNA